MSEQPTVWIPKSAGHSFKAAETFGELRFIFDDSVSPFNLDLIKKVLYSALQDMQEEDFLLLSGSAIFNALTLLEWSYRSDFCNLLLFHARDREYIQRRLCFKEWEAFKENG